MAKFFGPIGFAVSVEERPGVYRDRIEEHNYVGDVKRNSSRWTSNPDSTLDDMNINNQFSIIADPFAQNNFHTMKYLRYMGTNWKITNVEVQYPRLVLTVGGVYNGPTA